MYIGVTGCTSPGEVGSVVGMFGRSLMPKGYIGSLGFLVSDRTLQGQTGSVRYPPIDRLPELVSGINGCWPVIHYNTHDQESLDEQLITLFKPIVNCCQAVQLNMEWPKPHLLKKAKQRFNGLRFILQLRDPNRDYVSELKNYYGLVSHILLDTSMGKGKKLNPAICAEVHGVLYSRSPTVKIGFAGGLNHYNLESLVRKIRMHTSAGFSIDAESGLRDKKDQLDLNKTLAYISSAAKALS